MLSVNYDRARNLVLIEFKGVVTLIDSDRFFAEVEHILPRCSRGFVLMTDMSELVKIESDVKGAIIRSMDLFNSLGVKNIIRVIPDPAKDIGLGILSIFHYGRDVKIATVQTRAEAEERLAGIAPDIEKNITVYYGAPSIYGRKVFTVLQEKGLAYDIRTLDFAQQDHLKDDYLKLNPNGEIPTLVDGDRVIYESTAIIEYLDEQYPDPPLMPPGPYERAQVRMIEDFCDLHLYPAIRVVARKTRRQEEVTEDDRRAVQTAFMRIVEYLGAGRYFVADRFTLAECAVMPAIASLPIFGFGDLLESLTPSLKALRDRPSFRGASFLGPRVL